MNGAGSQMRAGREHPAGSPGPSKFEAELLITGHPGSPVPIGIICGPFPLWRAVGERDGAAPI